jgi:hypothetical protein
VPTCDEGTVEDDQGEDDIVSAGTEGMPLSAVKTRDVMRGNATSLCEAPCRDEFVVVNG